MTIDELVEAYGEALRRSAKANAAEKSADEARKIVRAEQIVKSGEASTSKATIREPVKFGRIPGL